MYNDPPASLIREMLDSARIAGPTVDALMDKAVDSDYWRRLHPAFGIDLAERVPFAHSGLSSTALSRLAAKFAKQGYFHTDPAFPAEMTDKMRVCIERIRAEGWPQVFAFVYDPFWEIFRTEPVQALLTTLLGPGCHQNSSLFAYYVGLHKGAAGWPPHTDGNGPGRATIWIPLTDATLDNGCMYVIPKDCVPASLPPGFSQWEPLKTSEFHQLLQSSRALPARAGALLGWDHELIHWGARCDEATTPRISIAVEFLSSAQTPNSGEYPLTDISSLPTFRERLYMIAKAVKTFDRFEILLGRYSQLAERLIRHCAQ